MTNPDTNNTVGLIVQQWLREWDSVFFSEDEKRRKPEPWFYLLTLPAQQLRKLSKIYRRRAIGARAEDTSIQRAHNPKRSAEIQQFIHGGFPWATLSDKQRSSTEFENLRMPGWLPTSIIANILPPGASRGKATLHESDAIRIEHRDEASVNIILPSQMNNPAWIPDVAPIEIIDGQHRLWAFEENEDLDGNYSLPVVAFYNLDITWQAYLFYTINIKPKRINASLAFDLYPILRVQDWLEKSPVGPSIYRETRAQELTEVLWSHPKSPWHNRINMLGESKSGSVTQAAFIRSLLSSYIKQADNTAKRLGGLFGSELNRDTGDVLRWNRPQQAAFLIFMWRSLALSITECTEPWALHLREIPTQQTLLGYQGDIPLDLAFSSNFSLISTDQGVRGILQVTNDMCYVAANQLLLSDWQWDEDLEEDIITPDDVSKAIEFLGKYPVATFMESVARELSKFDWRISSTPNLSENERRAQAIFRGSGGYKELRQQLLQVLKNSDSTMISTIAGEVYLRLGY